MRYSRIILPLGLAAAVIMVLGVGPTFSSESGASPYLESTSIGDSVIGGGAAGPFMLVFKGHGMGHRGFRSGIWLGGYPYRYGYGSSYPLEFNSNPSQTCVWNGYSYNCYNFPSERVLVY
jgi:hypothetical protein